MPELDIFCALLDYHHALYQRIWESIMTLTDAQFVEETGYSHGSLRNQMVHVIQTELRWILGLRGDQAARTLRLDPIDYPSRKSARVLWEDTAQKTQAYLDALTPEDLVENAPGMPGPRWQVLAHLVIHGTDHRAQILQVLHSFGAPTFDQDLIYQLWFKR